MASVDGRRSYLAGSDQALQHTCGPCKDDGEETEANYFCKVCSVYLCAHCRDEHKRFKATKNHSVISAHATSGQGSTTMKGAFVVLCGCGQKQAVEVFCENHVEVICPVCETIKHRNCKTCPIKDKVTKDTKKKLREVIDQAKSLQTRIETCKRDAETGRKKLKGTKEGCQKEITDFRQEIKKILEKMEKEILENLDKKANEQLQTIEKQISTLSATLQALSVDMDTLENADKAAEGDIMFVADVKISKSMSEYEGLVHDISKGMQQMEVEFQRNKNLTDMLNSMEGLGRIETHVIRSIKQDSTVILDMKVKSMKEVNIKSSDDSNDPEITGCAFLSNGSVLLCDYQNSKVKLLDSDWSVSKSLKLSDQPGNVAAVDANEAIITFLSIKDLQYISTHPDLKLGKTITLPEQCYGLQVVNDEIYTAYHKSSGHDEIWKLDRSGNMKSKIVLPQSSSYGSLYLGLGSLTDHNPRVYLTDDINSRVRCYQLDGRMVYQYKDKELTAPRGIYVDSAGNSLVCGCASDNVVVITSDGRKHRELLTSENITRPQCIDFRPEDNTLIVGCWCNSKLFVYKLGK